MVKTCLPMEEMWVQSRSLKIPWSRKWQLTLVFLPRNAMDREAWWATVHGVSKSWTWLSDYTWTTISTKPRTWTSVWWSILFIFLCDTQHFTVTYVLNCVDIYFIHIQNSTNNQWMAIAGKAEEVVSTGDVSLGPRALTSPWKGLLGMAPGWKSVPVRRGKQLPSFQGGRRIIKDAAIGRCGMGGGGTMSQLACSEGAYENQATNVHLKSILSQIMATTLTQPPCHLVASIVSLLALGSPLSPIAVRVRCKPDHFTSHLTLPVYDYLTLSFRANPASLHSRAWLSHSGLISSYCPGHRAATVSILLVLEPNESCHLSCFAPASHLPGRSLTPKPTSQSFSQLWAAIVPSTSSKTLSLAPRIHPPAIFCYNFFITIDAMDESIDFKNFVSKSSLMAVDLYFLPISVLQAQKRAGISGFHKHVWWMSAMLSQAHLDTPRWLYLKILNICKYLFPNKVTSIDSGLQIYIWRRGAQVNPLQFLLCINNLF